MRDDDRAVATKALANQIRLLSKSAEKLGLAYGLANLSTEGDFGRDTLQEVTSTLELAVNELPGDSSAKFAFDELAQLSRYEGMRIATKSPAFNQSLFELEALDTRRAAVDFTLTDLTGKTWTRSALKGKIVLVNFWATWCPPCRKEMPDLEELYNRFKPKGFVILAISDETVDKVQPFIDQKKYSFPVLLDPGRKVNLAYSVNGIPKSFVYGRDGKLAAQTIDMRTQKQFLALLARAGLK